jgi:predicted  nucleic acid-binding Zn-ribbon protein
MKTESVVPETEKDLKSTVDRWMRSVDEDEAKGTKDNEREY